MSITFVGMGLSLLFHILIPRYFGVSETADAFITAIKVVLLVDIIFREGAKFSLVPVFVENEKTQDNIVFQQLINEILTFAILVGVLFLIIIEITAPWISSILLPNIAMDARSELTIYLRISAPILILGCGSTILGAFLNSHKNFKSVALRNTMPHGMAIIGFFVLSGREDLPQLIIIAYLIGYIVYFSWLMIRYYNLGYKYKPKKISLTSIGILKNTLSLPTLGFALRQMTARIIIEVFLIGRLGKGAITLYNSAFRIFSAIQTLIGNTIATIGLPDMASNDMLDNKQELKDSLYRNIRAALYIVIPITIFLVFCSTIIVNIIYGSDKLDNQSLQQISQLLFWLSSGIVFSCLIPVLNAGLYAQKEFRLIFRNMVTMSVINFIMAVTLYFFLGLNGVAIAVSGTAIIATINLTYLLKKTGIFLLQKK
ncbi:oligosaccharide flippase family protein [Candidatus Poribacteria bacterium]|nr:oligosaccharide flippase family protein [Candidatus Poribacteria bacterium]